MIDLRSDTVTRPSRAMLDAMMAAPTGDEQRGDDPTVNRLCAMMAERLNKEAAMFLPSGTMANSIAMLIHCSAGDEIIVAEDSHISYSEGGGASALVGAQLAQLPHSRGEIALDTIGDAIRPDRPQTVRSRLLLLEQTSNRAGGYILKPDYVQRSASLVRDRGLAVHMDGARLFNAEVGSAIAASTYASAADTVYVDLSKGLGCPFGAILAGPGDMLELGWRYKMRLGGGMRQAGIMAAAGIHALENNVSRLRQDHDNARALATGINAHTRLTIDVADVETNIVLADCRETGLTSRELCDTLARHGVRANPNGKDTIRLVTHLDFRSDDIDSVVESISRCADRSQ